MAPNRSRTRWAPYLAALAGVAALLWLALGGGPTLPGADPADEAASGAAVAPPAPRELREPAHRIAESERLTLEADTLPVEGALALALDLPDEARGDSPRDARVLGPDGEQLRTTATSLPGAGRGVRIEIDSSWLRPGRYLIEVETTEKTHFPLRRYVLEIR